MLQRKLLILLVTCTLLLLVTAVLAAPDAFDLSWWTADSGGGQSAAAGYTLHGTIGQPDGGTLAGGPYTLSGGFWGGPFHKSAPPNSTYLPLVR